MLIAKGEHAPSMDLNKKDKFRAQFVRMGPGRCVPLSIPPLFQRRCRADAARFLQRKQSRG